MFRLSSALALVSLAVGLPAQAQQPARILEFGMTGGVSHHDFHYRYPGGEAGVSAHWRELALGFGGEYGRVPRTEYALRPYYGRIVARVAYRAGW